ncbi:MAG TPA: response regulator transcription factor [Acidimicrobiales bacterium]|nr:response regulator transcription factor [Acidimicrobiales bacterium]
MAANITVLVVDDDEAFIDRLARALEGHQAMTVRAARPVLGEAEDAVLASQPDVVLVAEQLADASGLELLRRLGGRTSARLALVSTHADEALAVAAIEAGAAGYLVKESSAEDLESAVHDLAFGAAALPVRLIPSLVGRLAPERLRTPVTLTARELEVLQLVARGATNASIAKELAISVNTVRNHLQAILVKLGAHTKAEAVVRATQLAILPRASA